MSTAALPTNELERRKLVRLRVRSDLGITPQKYEGRTCYVVKDPVSLRYYRFNDQEFFVVQHFDGQHTLEDTQKEFEKKFRPHRLTLEDLEHFAQQLLTAGLVQHETAQAGKQLYDKRRKQHRMQRIATWTNVLYIKLPVFDPDRLLTRMIKYLWWIFTPWFFAASITLMLSAVTLVVTHFQTFYDKLPDYQEFFRWNTLLYLWVSLGVVKVIHEFGHGLSCKAFGGECHEMGALFLCFSPCLYANVSDSWTLPSKWKRIIVSFAGIYVELVIASIATFVWWNTPGRPLVNHVSLCVMVLCSVSTVIFNANPLMRFDGYYMLADWMEIPNLRDRANRLLKNLACEHGLGMEVQPEPYMEFWRMVMFVIFAIVSYVYRWVVTFSILFFLSNWLKPYKLGSLSALLTVAAVGSMVGWPLYRLAKGYSKRGRFPDMKPRRVSVTAAIVTALVLAFFLLPLPIGRVRQTGLIQLDRDALGRGRVVVPDAALLKALHVRNGQYVHQGQLLAEFYSPKLVDEKSEAEQYRQVYQAEADAAQRRLNELKDLDERKQAESDKATALSSAEKYAQQVRDLQARINELHELRAPCDGVVMGAPTPEEVGKLWDNKDVQQQAPPFCLIGEAKKLRMLVPVPPADYQLLMHDLRGTESLPVSVFVKGKGILDDAGRVVRRGMPETDAKEVPLQLTHRGGGSLAVKPSADPRQMIPQSQQYLVEVELDRVDPAMTPGTLAQVKIHCQWKSCAWWVWRTLSSALDIGLM
jgi:putative peptide zinc metalloprotease protein